jgi:hypothetical protein
MEKPRKIPEASRKARTPPAIEAEAASQAVITGSRPPPNFRNGARWKTQAGPSSQVYSRVARTGTADNTWLPIKYPSKALVEFAPLTAQLSPAISTKICSISSKWHKRSLKGGEHEQIDSRPISQEAVNLATQERLHTSSAAMRALKQQPC